jgi:FkbM family methyltransferase
MIFDIKSETPIIFDLGGHKGDWVQIALTKYPKSIIYVFEPIKLYYDLICDRFKSINNVKVFNFAISDKTYETEISIEGDRSSIHFDSKTIEKECIKVKNIREFLFEEQIFFVDLIKINIEGEEYNLLEYLMNTPELCVFQNYVVQFHRNIENHISRRNFILNNIKKFYDIIFSVDFVWEGWSIKKIKK